MASEKITKKMISFRLDPDEEEYLRQLAEEYGVSLSQIIRWAIKEYIDNH